MTTTSAELQGTELQLLEHERTFDVFRHWGHLEANLNPFGGPIGGGLPELRMKGKLAEQARGIYCGSIGFEFMHLPNRERREWLQEKIENPGPVSVDRRWLTERLLQADLFEQILQKRYLGTKRYSGEGNTSQVPLLDMVLETAAEQGGNCCVMGCTHRGRLSLMMLTVGIPPEDVLAGFEDVDPRSVLGGGDVKYHKGATGEFQTRSGKIVRMHMVSNPSHLEAVDPVALGRTRAKQTHAGENGEREVFPIIMHGDAAFAGQGILAETLNFAGLKGFSVGGAIHIIVNNLIGFTTTYRELHTSRFSADLAKRQPVPIFHVNTEDPEAVLRVAKLATEYRFRFGSDVVIDLIGYRRHGHSEVDDPTITQPLLYKKIKEHPPLWEIYADDTGAPDAQARADAIRAEFEAAQKKAGSIQQKPLLRELPNYWDKYKGGRYKPQYEVDTGLTGEELRALTERLIAYPEGFHIHPKVKKLLEQRGEMGAGKRAVDYGVAEALAFASRVKASFPVRLSGQDTRRGTFNQRHSVLVDIENEHEHVPLENISEGKARCE